MEETFGEAIRKARENAGLTQSEVAASLNASKGYVSQLETGFRTGITGENLVRLCAVLKVPQDYFAKYLAPGVTIPPPPHQPTPTLTLPDFGEVPCGPPEIRFTNPPGFATVSPSQYGDERFVLRAKGDSMTGRNIQSGDLLIFRQSRAADHGDVVVAWTGNGTTVKVYHLRGEGANAEHWLYPASEHGKPVMMTADYRVIGVLKGVMRDVQPAGPKR